MNSIIGFVRSLPSGYRRIVVLLITLPVLWACNARSLTAPETHPVQVGTQTFQQTLNREIDILFMIDDSPSMLPLQTKLLANFPVFMNVLKASADGLAGRAHRGRVSKYGRGDLRPASVSLSL